MLYAWEICTPDDVAIIFYNPELRLLKLLLLDVRRDYGNYMYLRADSGEQGSIINDKFIEKTDLVVDQLESTMVSEIESIGKWIFVGGVV